MLFVNLRLEPNTSCGLASFFLRATYEGYLEGKIPTINRKILEKAPKEAANMFWGKSSYAAHVHIVPPCYSNIGRLPKYVCFALLCSSLVKGRHDSENSEWSECVCCWFTSDADLPITELVARDVYPFDWDRIAVNCAC